VAERAGRTCHVKLSKVSIGPCNVERHTERVYKLILEEPAQIERCCARFLSLDSPTDYELALRVSSVHR
jgi:hypothetical protein